VKQIASFAEIIPQYDTFVFDIWGVVHDGYRPFPKLRASLEQLKAEGKQVIFLSNMSQLSSEVERHLGAMSVPRELYDFVHSSGQAAREHIATRAQNNPVSCFHVNDDPSFRQYFTNLNVTFVDDVSLADFLLVARGDLHAAVTEQSGILQEAIARNLPLICANPDTGVVIEGKFHARSGSLTHIYEKLGGTVISFGKPYPEIFQDLMKNIPPTARIIMIGDSLETDIMGAQTQGWDTMLVLTGVTAHTHGWLHQAPTQEDLAPLLQSKTPPTFVFRGFAA